MFLYKNLSGAELPVGLWHMVDKLLTGQTEASGSEVSQSPAQRGELEVLRSRVCKRPVTGLGAGYEEGVKTRLALRVCRRDFYLGLGSRRLDDKRDLRFKKIDKEGDNWHV